MSLGELKAIISLDDPERVHHGHAEPVKGTVRLTYRPSQKTVAETSTELFGPLHVAITLHGRTKSKIWKRRGEGTTLYRGRFPLFSHSVTIYDEVFKASPGETHLVPFEIAFPPHVQWESDHGWKSASEFLIPHPEMPLPPTMYKPRGLHSSFAGFVEYRLSCSATMRGIKVDLSVPNKDEAEHIKYEQPQLHSPLSSTPHNLWDTITAQNKQLLPEADRPKGFWENVKAAVKSDFYPRYVFSWHVDGPRGIYHNQPLAFDVRIRICDEQCTAPVIPQIRLGNFTAEIQAVTKVRTRGAFNSYQSASGNTTLERSLVGIQGISEPFGTLNDWAMHIEMPAISPPTTFRTVNIAVAYRIKLHGTFSCAGTTKNFSESWYIDVHPPIATPIASESAPMNGHVVKAILAESRVDPDMPRDEDLPPPMYEAGPSRLQGSPIVDSQTEGEAKKEKQ